MSSSSDFSAEQLTAARTTAWHQDGKALETLESARSWVDHYGFVLYAPRAAQLGAPAPSFVEVTIGAANDAPSAANSSIARALVARLVAEGSAVPLNLLGSAGDNPDFLASAKVFPYIFTMRGDKAWKQPPQTTGTSKVSPLALRVYEVLQDKGAMSASELASELGREVTEAAIQRALGELWAQLRVIPQLHQDEKSATLWELLSVRFSKAIKAGANAGQPSAMSALLSLYLTQAVAATEEEVAGFLSPLTARSRVREVVHALVAGRQLDATVVDGKTLLYISGVLPEFAPTAKAEGKESEATESEKPAYTPKKVGTGRIGKFAGAADNRARTDFKGKPARSFGAGSSNASGSRGPARKYGTGVARAYSPRPDTERRPFKRKEDSGDGKPSFAKPWEEGKRPRRTEAQGSDALAVPRERKPYTPRPNFGTKPPFGTKKAFGDRKPYAPREGGGEKPGRRSFGDKPSFGTRGRFGDRPARTRREADGESFASRERPSYSQRDGGPPRERKSFGAAEPFGDRKPYAGPKSAGERKTFGDRKPFAPRPEGSSDVFVPRERPSYPKREGSAAPRSYERKPFAPREGLGGDERPRRGFGDRPAYGGGASKPGSRYSKFSKPEGGAARSFSRSGFSKPSYGGGGSKPSSSEAKPGGFSKPFATNKPSFGGGRPTGKPASRPSSGYGPSKLRGTSGSKPGRPYTKRPGQPGTSASKPEAEE